MDENGDEGTDLSIVSETENYAVLLGQDMDGQPVYSIELGSVTLHLFQEEWDELVELINSSK